MKQTEADKRPLQIGMFGFGVVGTAVYQILQQQGERLARHAGVPLAVKRVVVRNLEKERVVAVPDGLLTTDPGAVLDDPGIDLVVEVMGGLQPARDYVLGALRRGKSVITANKELVADHSQELLAVAQQNGADLFFEASVGGGIPVLRPLLDSLSAGEIRKVMGIVNGTTNYILDQMARGGKAFAEALAEAQALGYAEADPTADVEGHDPARKIAILSSIAFRTHVKSTSVPAEGITRVAPEDMAYGAQRGWALKLLAYAERHDEEIETWVQPCFIPSQHPLAGVGDAFNAIYVHGAEVGETMFCGRGAGGMPTGSAVIGDLLAAAGNRRRGVSVARPWAERPLRVRSAAETAARFYLRLEPLVPSLARAEVAATAAAGAGPSRTSHPAAGAELAERLSALGAPVERHLILPNGQVAVETGLVGASALRGALAELAAVVRTGISIRILA